LSNESEIPALRSRVTELEARLEYIYKHLRIEYSDNPDAANQRVIDMLKTGDKIEAIKVYREIHNVGLAEAKQAVDGMESRFGLYVSKGYIVKFSAKSLELKRKRIYNVHIQGGRITRRS